MKKESKKRLSKMILLGFGIPMISMITGYGMFWHYQMSGNFNMFFNMKVGMFSSALMSSASTLVLVLIMKEENPNSRTKKRRKNIK